MSDQAAIPPADRYGRRRRTPASRRRLAIGLTVLVLVLGVLIAVEGYRKLGGGDVSGSLAAYQLIDDQTAEVTLTVTRKDPSRPVVCIARARSKDGTETGRREILVGPSTDATVQVVMLVKTSKPPVTGDAYGCGTVIPSYLVAPS
ncbi:DUF4307 domain-containing protein [Mycolicibacterium fallax]|uniref:Uncharacterized protein n=1 Tax=Mycolicibacterium fallax TaxID=1793 RepID=A0A1X1REJ1_MYCFA|nr:DUF4307 domain-containing protein [Mycolicibacterium fallax]ORV04073.1 hypothetical protein AWC04_09600 [Mycolicibacterium fallax]BBZ00303.1 hypothetical protein MFAL_37690 [Mycolicibacterium fallax]HOW93765.1 DUF4307 domain-containing protein [Mycolicibacterium fallax]HSA40346.1 DUF4307 domain-containing protein [Mycobacterium sp.]